MTKSEFGKGLTYCLGLFLAHERDEMVWGTEGRKIEKLLKRDIADLWFNGASDHLYELEIPDWLPLNIKRRLAKLQNKALHWGHGFDIKAKPTKKDVAWALDEAKKLLRLIDNFHDIKTSEATWK